VKEIADCRLYAFIDTAYLHGRAPGLLAQQLCDGGADLIQLRAKNSAIEEVRSMASTILPITRRAGVGLVINDHLLLARDLASDFCHLGQEDFFGQGFASVAELPIRRSEPRIGISTHAPEQAQRAVNAGADYIAIGPVFATGTKPTARPVTLDYVRWAAANLSVPWFAIGGIDLQNLDSVLTAGATRICAVSAILNSSDPAATCREFKRRLPP
jgi:thiamine-phosphate pyrophosphorylase